jgi:hypothetical protein|tara:strand:+ start:5402 stop:5995 length:594 start_codon:yes stop_codon:yes gene_type:complete
MKQLFERPIPGQSLTDEPKGYPWERPPVTADPNEAIKMHLDRFAEPPFIDAALFMMESGIPIATITKTNLTVAQASGIHSIDVSILIAPVIHRQFKLLAESAGIKYLEYFPSDDPEGEIEREDRMKELLSGRLSELKGPEKKAVSQTIAAIGSPEEEELEDRMEEQSAAPEEAMAQAATDMPPETEAPKAGLMSREA